MWLCGSKLPCKLQTDRPPWRDFPRFCEELEQGEFTDVSDSVHEECKELTVLYIPCNTARQTALDNKPKKGVGGSCSFAECCRRSVHMVTTVSLPGPKKPVRRSPAVDTTVYGPRPTQARFWEDGAELVKEIEYATDLDGDGKLGASDDGLPSAVGAVLG